MPRPITHQNGTAGVASLWQLASFSLHRSGTQPNEQIFRYKEAKSLAKDCGAALSTLAGKEFSTISWASMQGRNLVWRRWAQIQKTRRLASLPTTARLRGRSLKGILTPDIMTGEVFLPSCSNLVWGVSQSTILHSNHRWQFAWPVFQLFNGGEQPLRMRLLSMTARLSTCAVARVPASKSSACCEGFTRCFLRQCSPASEPAPYDRLPSMQPDSCAGVSRSYLDATRGPRNPKCPGLAFWHRDVFGHSLSVGIRVNFLLARKENTTADAQKLPD